MPRIDFKLWDRVYMLKLICSAQMTFSAFVVILYLYLVVLQYWTSSFDVRNSVQMYKCSVIVVTFLDFCVGTFLAVASNLRGLRRKRGLNIWIILEVIMIPTSIFLVMQLYFRIRDSKVSLSTDIHYKRVNIVQVLFMLFHYVFVVYIIDFLVSGKQRKSYDPRIRPEKVSEPTYPQITTTESRHIRMGESLLIHNTSMSQMKDEKEKEKTKKEISEEKTATDESKVEDEEKEVATTSSQK